MNNLKDVLGENVWSWWYPQTAPGDGLKYKVGEGLGELKLKRSWRVRARRCWKRRCGKGKEEKEKLSDSEESESEGEGKEEEVKEVSGYAQQTLLSCLLY